MAKRNSAYNVCWLDGSIIKVNNVEVRTVLDLKKKIEKEIGLPVSDQKIIIKGKIVKADNSIFVQPDEIINLLTIESHKIQEIKQYFHKIEPQVNTRTMKSEALPQKITKTSLVKQAKVLKNQRKKNLPIQKKNKTIIEAGILSKKNLRQIFIIFFDKCQFFKEKRQQIVADDEYLIFFLLKITQKNPFLRNLHRQDKNMLRDALIEIDSSILNPETELKQPEEIKTIEQQMIQNLVESNFDREKAIKAVEIAQNDVEKALQILMNEEDKYSFQIDKPMKDDEKLFIFKWFTHPQKKQLRLRLSLSIQNMYKYVNSMKHRCPDLYKILCCNLDYANRVINLPIKIDSGER